MSNHCSCSWIRKSILGPSSKTKISIKSILAYNLISRLLNVSKYENNIYIYMYIIYMKKWNSHTVNQPIMKIQGLMNTNQIKAMRYQNEHNQSNLKWNNIEKRLKASKLCQGLFRSF